MFVDDPAPATTPSDGRVPPISPGRIIPSTVLPMPIELPEQLAREMSQVHRSTLERTGSHVEAMRAAYRLLLDTVA